MQNFTRVFEVPASSEVGSHPFVNSGGIDYPVKLVDWFDSEGAMPLEIIEDRETWAAILRSTIKRKHYIRPFRHYVAVCDSGHIIGVTGAG